MTQENQPKYDSKWQYWSMVIMIYSCLVAMGVVENARSVTFPLMKSYFDISYDTYGFFSSSISIAYIVFCLLASFVSEYIGYKWIIIIGYILITAGCFLTQLGSSFFLVGIFMFIIWMGFGFFEIGANASATLVFIEHKGTMMSLMHFFYGIGAVIGPNVARWSLSLLNNSFYSVYFFLGFILLVLTLFSLLLPFKLPKCVDNEEDKGTLTLKSAFLTPSVWLCSFCMAMGNAVEAAGANWAPLYLVDVLNYDIATDVANFTTVLYIIFTVSRLVSGPMIDKLGYYTSLFISYISCFFLMLIGFFLGRWGIVPFAMTGFFYSANWPIFVCVMMGYYKKDAAVVTSLVIVLQGVILAPITYILGVLNESWGAQWAYQTTLLFCLLGALSLACVHHSQKKKEKQLPIIQMNIESESDEVNKNEKNENKDLSVSISDSVSPLPASTSSLPASTSSLPASTSSI